MSLDDRLGRLQGHGRLPSVVAGVATGGEVTWVGGAGDVPADAATTQYRIGSITKTFVAVLVMRARDAGLLSLDDPIGRFVPETAYAEATVGALLSHTSGMQSEPVGPWWERSPGRSMPDLLAANDGSGRVAPDGAFYHYSNLGFALLGEAVARLRERHWWDLVMAELLEPLGMVRTTYLPEAPHARGCSVVHFTDELQHEPHQDTGAMAPAGQAWSTVTDLLGWADFLATGHPDVLTVETLDEMATPRPPAAGYGLGLRLIEAAGRPLTGHTGSMPGFLASLFVDRSSRDASVLMTNATSGIRTEWLPEVLLGAEEPDPVEPWVPSLPVPESLSGVPGLWFWGNTAMELRWQGGRLWLTTLGNPDRAASADVFDVTPEGILGVSGYHRGETLHVVRRSDGSVSYLTCATFVYTKIPYDPDVNIPGGHP